MLSIRQLIETFYYLSGITVAIGVLYAIRQYKLSKKDSRLKFSREINSITSNQLERFYLKIIPMAEKMNKMLKTKPFFVENDKNIVDINDVDLIGSAKSYLSVIEDDVRKLMREITIEMQIIAVNFEYGRADSNLAGKTISKKFIDIYENVLPEVIDAADNSMYSESLKLYNNWRVEYLKEELSKKQVSLMNDSKEIKGFKLNR